MRKYRFLLLRRVAQISILILFVLGNYSLIEVGSEQKGVIAGNISSFGIIGEKKEVPFMANIAQGNLSSSKILGVIPMSDPFVMAQMLLAGSALALDIWIGGLIVLLFYALIAGRAYCSYVCPMNLVTDLANYLRHKLGFNALKVTFRLSRNVKYGVLALSLVLSALLGVAAFEMINPMAMIHRGLAFGLGFGLFGVVAVFLFDFLLLKNGFCGHICPLGASYSLIGKYSMFRVKHKVENCTKCMRCVEICPEPQVLDIIGKNSGQIDAMACSKCGRCVEVCDDDALGFGILQFKKGEKNAK